MPWGNTAPANQSPYCQIPFEGKRLQMFSRIHGLMQDCYKTKPLKQELEQIIETLLP